MLPVADQLSYVDEVPRFWFSRRWRLAFLGFVGFLIVTCQRISIEVAIISMLNQTTPSAAIGAVSAAHAAGFSRGYWSTRLGSAGPPLGGDTPPRGTNAPPIDEEVALAYYGGTNGTSKQETVEEVKGRATKTSSHGLEESVVRSRVELSRMATDGCSNASELAILNTTLFNLRTTGDISWTLTEQCGVLDAFYWGDLLIRIPSGFLSQRYGGKRVFGFAMLLSSICTAVIPITSRVHYFAVILLRFITGASVGATIPAMSYLLGRWCPPDERCILQSITNTGTSVSGAVISIPLIGLLCTYGFDGGWPSAFYISGGLGMLWSIIWMLLANDSPNDDSRISAQEKDYINSTIINRSNSTSIIAPSANTVIYRWEVLLTSLPVLAVAVNHFTHEWVVCVLMKVIPIYLTDVLHMDFKQNSVGTLVLPSVAFWSVMAMSAGAADRLQAYGVLGVTKIRKLMHTVGAVLTAAMISSVLLMDCHHHLATLSLLTLGLSFCGLQYSGALVAHLDVAPGCAGVTMGVVSALGASAYFVLPALVQMVLHVPTQSAELKWSIVLLLTASCHIFSSLIFLVFGSSKWYSWSADDGGPLVIDDGSAAAAAEATKTNAEDNSIFAPSHPEFSSSVSNYGYFNKAAPHPHPLHPQPQYQQQQSEDDYHEAIDPDDADLMDTDSSNRSVTGVHRQTSDDSCSHSCVSAASEISEGFHSSANRPSNSSSGTGATPAAEADEGYKRRLRPMTISSTSAAAAAAALATNDLSESIV